MKGYNVMSIVLANEEPEKEYKPTTFTEEETYSLISQFINFTTNHYNKFDSEDKQWLDERLRKYRNKFLKDKYAHLHKK